MAKDKITEIGGAGSFTNLFRTKMVDSGAKILKIHGHGFQASGWPDNYIAHHLWNGWIELKVDKEPLSALQRMTIGDLRERGVLAWVARYHNETKIVTLENERGDTFEQFAWGPAMTGPAILRLLASLFI